MGLGFRMQGMGLRSFVLYILDTVKSYLRYRGLTSDQSGLILNPRKHEGETSGLGVWRCVQHKRAAVGIFTRISVRRLGGIQYTRKGLRGISDLRPLPPKYDSTQYTCKEVGGYTRKGVGF